MHFQFDVICLWDVFEHIKDRISFLKILKNHLHKNGLIFLQIPNADSLAARILQEKCKLFGGFEHVNLYNPSTIKKIAQKAGLHLVKIVSIINEMQPILNF